MKKLIALLAAVFLLLPGCGTQRMPDTGYTKYSAQFYGGADRGVLQDRGGVFAVCGADQEPDGGVAPAL